MRKLMISFLIVFAPILCFSQGVKFEAGTLPELKAKAQQENKFLFIDCYATWCGPCKMMDRDVYTDKNVGDYLSANFISAKYQFDKTAKDDAEVKSRYGDVSYLNETFKIEAFPALIILDPEGNLVSKFMGFRDPEELKSWAAYALSDEKKNYDKVITDWKAGKRDYESLLPIITTTREVVGNKELAREMFADYKRNYLDKQQPESLANKDVIDAFTKYPDLVTSKDPFFQLNLERRELVNKIDPRIPSYIVETVITKEEVTNLLWKDDKPVTLNPQWTTIQTNISAKYGKELAGKIVLEGKLNFYKGIKNWNEFTRIYDESLKGRKLTGGGGLGGAPWELNLKAWETYLSTSDKPSLTRALNWVTRAIDLANQSEEPAEDQFYDTKGRLLYKLGRTKEAIATQTKAVELCQKSAKERKDENPEACSLFSGTLILMQQGKSIQGKYEN